MQISSFISDSYSINLCLGYQLCLICLLIPLYFSTHLHRYPGIILPNVWTLPSESCLPFCLVQVYSYLCGQGGDVTGIYIHYRDYKHFCLIIIRKRAHDVNTHNIPGFRAFNSAFGKVPLFIILSQLALRACANYLTVFFPSFGCHKFPVEHFPGLVFAR